MAVTITVTITGTASAHEIEAATLIVEQENERRATLDPPGTPLSTQLAQLAASYSTVLTSRIREVHASYVSQAAAVAFAEANAQTLWEAATPQQRVNAVAALQA